MKTGAKNPGGSQVASPCVRNCCLDENDVCMGCGRHINEILAWHQATGDEREEIISLAMQRLEQRKARHHARNS